MSGDILDFPAPLDVTFNNIIANIKKDGEEREARKADLRNLTTAAKRVLHKRTPAELEHEKQLLGWLQLYSAETTVRGTPPENPAINDVRLQLSRVNYYSVTPEKQDITTCKGLATSLAQGFVNNLLNDETGAATIKDHSLLYTAVNHYDELYKIEHKVALSHSGQQGQRQGGFTKSA